jgi:hypothetical protein
MIYQDATHQLRGNRIELGPVFPLHAGLVDQAQVGLVYETATLQRMPRVFSIHVTASNPPQFPIN